MARSGGAAAVAAILGATIVFSARPGAQEVVVRDPHVRPPVIDAGPLVRIDDMLFAPEQLSPPASRPQGLSLNAQSPTGAWDAGIIPYEIAAEFTAVERQRIVDALAIWMRTAPVRFVPRTSQLGYASIEKAAATETQATPCYSSVGQFRRGAMVRTNLGGTCATSSRTIAHELGHLLGLWHEQSRADRDDFVTIDMGNVIATATGNFTKLSALPLVGPYDFRSIMHYARSAFAIDATKPTIMPHAAYAADASVMGTLPEPSATDHEVLAILYNAQLRPSTNVRATESVRSRFDRTDFLLAMERLHAFYMSRWGLQREGGLSIDGRPDFLGIAQWIFGVYLGARSGGFSADGAFDIVTAAITQSEEWQVKNAGRSSLTPAPFNPYVSFDRTEFLDAMMRLDGFYASADGLQRPGGLSINGGPDFLGIAAWIFDVYLGERLRGTSATAAWVLTENAIKATDEWRGKH